MKRIIIISMAAVVGSLSLQAGAAEGEKSGWTEKIDLTGDVRFRGEYIDQDDKAETRERLRVRARIAMAADVNEEIEVKVRLASGGDDPVSSNQSLDGGFSSKNLRLDRAYLTYSPEAVEGLDAWLGKMKNPWLKVSDLMWDGDLNPEGIALKVGIGEGIQLMANAGLFAIEERSSADDTYLYTGQIGAQGEVADGVKVLAGVGYFSYDNMQGFAPAFDETDGSGNSVLEDEEGALTYVNEYGLFEALASVQADVGVPVKVFGNYLVNTEADTAGDTGFLVGVKAGKAKDPGSWEVGYDYRDLEADAVVGAFSDSDSFGGGTNGDGSRIKAKYQLAKNWQAAGTLFFNSIDPDGSDVDYTRVQLDLIAKF